MKKCSSGRKKKCIIITGSSGFIGAHLSEFLEKKYNVFNIVSAGKGKVLKNRIILDLSRKSEVNSCFRNFGKKYDVYALINLAAVLASPDNAEDLNLLYDNLRIIEGVTQIAKLVKPKKLINFSSIAVYPNKDGVYNEESETRQSLNSECIYGLSKYCGENILDFMLRKQDIVISHLRISQVYGTGMRNDRIIPIMARELEEKNTITVFGSGKRISNFIHIDKLLDIVDIFIRKNLGGIFNVGRENLSYLELAKKIIKQTGNRNSRIIKKPHGSTAKFYLDVSKLKGVIG